MFYVTVKKNGISGVIRYENGRLSGDHMLLQYLLAEIAARRDEDVGPIMYSPAGGDHLKDPVSVRLIIEDVFGDAAAFSGDVPEWPQLPKGWKG